MRRQRKLAGLLAFWAIVLPLSAASATITTFDLAGTFYDGATLSGSFSLDDTKSGDQQFLNANVTVSGRSTLDLAATDDASTYYPTSGPPQQSYRIIFYSSNINDYDETIITVPAIFSGASFSTLKLIQILGTQLSFAQYYVPEHNDFESLLPGRGTIIPEGSVPEPASWMLMMMGFGAIGTVCRRKNAAVQTRPIGSSRQPVGGVADASGYVSVVSHTLTPA